MQLSPTKKCISCHGLRHTCKMLIRQARALSRSLASTHSFALHSCAQFSSSTSSHYAQLEAKDVDVFRHILRNEHGSLLQAGTVDADVLKPYNRDWLGCYQGNTKLVLRPSTTEQVSAIMRHANERHLPVVPQGGNTGLVGGSVAVKDEIVMSLSRMDKVLSFDQSSGALVAQAGCILQNLDSHVAPHGFLMPLDLGAKGSCQIGGNVSTNAGGLRLLRYGPLHGSVLGLKVVLPNGQVLDLLKTLRKDNTGIDLKHLFIGSEGTLGVVTGVSIQCAPRPTSVQVVFLGMENYEAVTKVLSRARRMLGEILSAFEFMDAYSIRLATSRGHVNPLANSELSSSLEDHQGAFTLPYYVLLETHGSNADHDKDKLETFLEAVMAEGEALDGTVAQSLEQINQIWRLREGISECLPSLGAVYKYDVSLPVPMFHRMLEDVREKLKEFPGALALGYGHMGDGNLHLNITSPEYSPKLKEKIEPYVFETLAAMKGSISAEHGIGQMKADALHYSRPPEVIDTMRAIKQLFDPNGICNPYKMLPRS